MLYNDKVYVGPHYAEIFAEALAGSPTISKKLVKFIDNVKTETYFTTISGDIAIQEYNSNPTTPSEGMVFSDQPLKPIKNMVHFRVDPETLRFSRFVSDKPGVNNIVKDELQNIVISYAQGETGDKIETMIWGGITAASKTAIAASSVDAKVKTWSAAKTAGNVDGLVSRLAQAEGVQIIAGTTLTESNLKAEYNKVLKKIPAKIRKKAAIYAPFSHELMILQANQSETYRDVFTVVGDQFYFLGVKIEFTGQDENILVAGLGDHLAVGSDVLSDTLAIETGKVSAESDLVFYKGVFSMDTAVVLGNQFVLYVG